jgi:prolyl-tRNA synthetase
MAVTDIGEDEIILCDSCGLGANVEKAVSIKAKAENGPLLPTEEVETPGQKTIEDLSAFLKIKPTQTLKAVFYMADGQLIFAVIRGDLEVNEIKLKKVLHAADLRLASDEEVRAKGIVPGSASPVGIMGVKVVADESVNSGANFVAGANKQGRHLRNVNYPRDFKSEIVADISKASAGDTCAVCGGTLRTVRGMEVGHVFKLGTSISSKLGANFVDENGASHPIIMGCYGIGIGRLMAAVIELNHDDKGIIWPKAIAPFQVYLCPLYMDNADVVKQADAMYAELSGMGIEVLYDDRTESPGVKFNDADLLGIPVRITVSPRSLEKASVEIKLRSDKKAELVPVAEAISRVKALLEG